VILAPLLDGDYLKSTESLMHGIISINYKKIVDFEFTKGYFFNIVVRLKRY